MFEKFNIGVAIASSGNCSKQKVSCNKCKIGNLLFMLGYKKEKDDLCQQNLVYLLARTIRDCK